MKKLKRRNMELIEGGMSWLCAVGIVGGIAVAGLTGGAAGVLAGGALAAAGCLS